MNPDFLKLNWHSLLENLNSSGAVLQKKVLDEASCSEWISSYDQSDLFRKTVVMEKYRFGSGEYKYFKNPEPEQITKIKKEIYPKLSPLANQWMENLGINNRFPLDLNTFQDLCKEKGQTQPTSLLLKYGKGGFNTLHQDLYGDIYFPIQLAFFLNEPDKDYEGGEFVLTQSRPRAQSKPIVFRPERGDMIIFTTDFFPVKGVKGYYRSQVKHGVSEVHSGNRHTLGIIFHYAVS
ncbi:prolyl 4-hydroxylase subunit alpha [Leptospira selangorensis]|uniref:2OG-Fe(II) oxygenase n=1 Tax=Leptospira selangorensis TaxID=2484982 RepID=UPI00108329DF|nr:2OG-Fe(II) oxygenase [Leptospira selangorensis]TGK04352.1 prolyl 4-hydroxylase subunit alpha [Leptospira selangorensis]